MKFGYEIQLRLDLPPVVVRLPVAQNLLDRFERHALGVVPKGLLFRQACLLAKRDRENLAGLLLQLLLDFCKTAGN